MCTMKMLINWYDTFKVCIHCDRDNHYGLHTEIEMTIFAKLVQYDLGYNYERIFPIKYCNLSCIEMETIMLVDKIVAYLFFILLIQYINEEEIS